VNKFVCDCGQVYNTRTQVRECIALHHYEDAEESADDQFTPHELTLDERADLDALLGRD